jgi:1-acyl-sn-glycerol-3-phosphate acyltransferase
VTKRDLPPELLDELRESVRALRRDLEERFGVGDPADTDDAAPDAPGELLGQTDGTALDAAFEPLGEADLEAEPVELDPEAPFVESPPLPEAAPGWLERLRAELGARLDEIDVVKIYESLRDRLAIPGAGDISAEVDDFGLDARYLARARRWLDWLYDSWWRVEVTGIEGVPETPRVLFVANSAGILPWDALMIAHAVERAHPSRRRPRPMVSDWIATLPFSQSRLARLGAVRACAENAERLLAMDQWVIAFPEGQKGALKPFRERYRLQRFARGGFVSLAARQRAALVPVAVIGSEEVHPILFEPRILRRLLGVPVPVTPTFPLLGPLGVVPLPSHWRIRFGEPIWFDDAAAERVADPLYVNRTREHVRSAIQGLLDEELPRRRSVFA